MGGDAFWETDTSIPLLHTTVGEALAQAAVRSPSKDAIRWMHNGRCNALTYNELHQRATARAFEMLSIASPGDRVAIWAPNSVEWVVLEYASALAGMIVIPLNPAAVDGELEYALESSGAALLYTVQDSHGKPLYVRSHAVIDRMQQNCQVVDLDVLVTAPACDLPTVRPEDPLLYQYTSGTTGSPKGAILSHYAAFNAARMYGILLDSGVEHQVSGAPLPYHHVAGSVSRILGSLAVDGTHVVIPNADLRELADTILACGVTHGGLVAKLAVDLLDDHEMLRRFDGHQMRTLGMGGAGIAPELIKRVEDALDVRVINGYGQSESPHITLTLWEDSELDRNTTIGRPVPQRDVSIMRLDGSTANRGELGEICTRGPLLMAGYLDSPEQTSATLINGWLHTGDLGSMDDRGYISYFGRAGDMIIRGGENIYPAEVESRLTEHAEILEVVVVGVPDPRWGEQVLAYVRIAPTSTLDEEGMRTHARTVLAPFKVPVFWEVVSDFPRGSSGKVLRRQLKSSAAEASLLLTNPVIAP